MVLRERTQQALKEAATLQGRGRLREAAEIFARVRATDGNEFGAWHGGGMVALLLGEPREAAMLLDRATKLNPASAPTALGLGIAQVAAGELSAGEKTLRQVTQRAPALAEGWHHLAVALKAAGRLDEALAAQRKAVTLKPHFARGWQSLAGILSMRGGRHEALVCYEKAIALEPQNSRARLGRAMMLYKSYRVAEAASEFAAVIAKEPRDFEARSQRLMALNALDGFAREAVFLEHCAFGEAAGEPRAEMAISNYDPERPLRVAFLSPDLRQHSVAFFLEPLLRELDRTRFEIVLYHDHPRRDGVTEKLRAYASRFRHFAGQVDSVVEKSIREDAPDILVDLAGHTGLNRLPLLARRVAPVQLTYLGYPNTTGVKAIDYRLVDAITDPVAEADAFHSETLLRFAPTGWSYQPPAEAPQPAAVPSATSGIVTFGSFNHFTKVTDRQLRLWAQLLAEVSNSRLVIKSLGLDEPAISDAVQARLAAAGLDPTRVELLPRTPDTASHLALYGRVDIALDTFPYHGTTTTCEALWMGVPVVTQVGDRHASRVGLSLLTAIGHPEWAAIDAADYLRIARELAFDRKRLATLRATLRSEMRASDLMNHHAQAARFGAALRDCWRTYCRSADAKTKTAAL